MYVKGQKILKTFQMIMNFKIAKYRRSDMVVMWRNKLNMEGDRKSVEKI